MKKVAYIIPGYENSFHVNKIRFVSTLFRKKSIIPIPVKIKWKYRTISDYLSDLFSQIHYNDNSEIYLFGFSFGAMIALLAAPALKPKKLYLCSLSPFFKEDLNHRQSDRKSHGKKRTAECMSISFDTIAKSVHCQTLLLVGDQETASVINRTKAAKSIIKKSKMYTVEHASHNLNDAMYQKYLSELI